MQKENSSGSGPTADSVASASQRRPGGRCPTPARQPRPGSLGGIRSSAIEFFIAFPVIWIAVVLFISRIGGWASLSRKYPTRPRAGGRLFRFQSGRMRFRAGYGGCLTPCSEPAGLHLSILFLFRPGHRPIFFPWSEVRLHEGSRRGVVLQFNRVPGVPLILSQRLAAELAEASAGGLIYPHAA